MKHIQKTILTFAITLLISLHANSQKIDNNLLGRYEGLYSSHYEFDANGKVIYNDKEGIFFTKGDSIIIFVDKSSDKFIKVKNKIIGASKNIKDEEWSKKTIEVVSKRKNDETALKNANLLNEYYKAMNMKDPYLYLFANNINQEKIQKVKNICEKGLGIACLGYSDFLYFEYIKTGSEGKMAKNDEFVATCNKAIELGETKGHLSLGIYYKTIGEKQKALQELKKGKNKGNDDCTKLIDKIEN